MDCPRILLNIHPWKSLKKRKTTVTADPILGQLVELDKHLRSPPALFSYDTLSCNLLWGIPAEQLPQPDRSVPIASDNVLWPVAQNPLQQWLRRPAGTSSSHAGVRSHVSQAELPLLVNLHSDKHEAQATVTDGIRVKSRVIMWDSPLSQYQKGKKDCLSIL